MAIDAQVSQTPYTQWRPRISVVSSSTQHDVIPLDGIFQYANEAQRELDLSRGLKCHREPGRQTVCAPLRLKYHRPRWRVSTFS